VTFPPLIAVMLLLQGDTSGDYSRMLLALVTGNWCSHTFAYSAHQSSFACAQSSFVYRVSCWFLQLHCNLLTL